MYLGQIGEQGSRQQTSKGERRSGKKGGEDTRFFGARLSDVSLAGDPSDDSKTPLCFAAFERTPLRFTDREERERKKKKKKKKKRTVTKDSSSSILFSPAFVACLFWIWVRLSNEWLSREGTTLCMYVYASWCSRYQTSDLANIFGRSRSETMFYTIHLRFRDIDNYRVGTSYSSYSLKCMQLSLCLHMVARNRGCI